MTPRALLLETAASFASSGVPDPVNDAALLLSSVCRRPPLVLRLDSETNLSESDIAAFRILAARRMLREPLQYILEEAPFYGAFFYVDEHVLIPRPETEMLCSWALELLQSVSSPSVLDLCSGSGCIGLTVGRLRPDAEIVLADVSESAMKVAAINQRRLGIRNIRMMRGDLWEAVNGFRFHAILSNPPYIPAEDCRRLQEEVRREPILALDGGADGLAFYRRICADALRHLYADGFLLMEVGAGQEGPVRELMIQAGFTDIAIREDFRAIPRMIMGRHA